MTLEQAIEWTKKNTHCESTRERLKSRAACFSLYQEILRLQETVEDLENTVFTLECDLNKMEGKY